MSFTRHTLATASAVLLLATLSACGGGNDPEATDAGPQGSAPNVQGGGPGGQAPGASGEVADVSGRTAQVQSQNGQVAVTWNGDTTFTEEVDAALADVTVGSCVMVTSADSTDADSTDAEATAVTAATVRVTEATDDGGCGFGAGGPGGDGQRPEGMPTDLPTDMPTDVPTDVPSGAPGMMRGGFGTVGEVTAVSADGFTVSSQRPSAEDATEVTVTVGEDTSYTTTATAQAAAVKVGRCVVARGDSDDTGAVTATTISVSDPVDGACQSGFMQAGRGPGGAA